MIEFTREQFKADPALTPIFELIKNNHKVSNHTNQILHQNRHVKDFCEEARHFIAINEINLYLHYDVSSWYHKKGEALVKIERIGLYDSFQEYESVRLRTLHSAKHQDGINLN